MGGALDQVQIWSQPWSFDLPLGVNWRCFWSIHPGGIYVYAGWDGTDDICSNSYRVGCKNTYQQLNIKTHCLLSCKVQSNFFLFFH